MLTVIIGKLGSGKTLFLVMLAFLFKRPIYSNFKLYLDNYVPLRLIDIISLPDGINVFIDEAYAWIDSRRFGNPINQYIGYIHLQSRKTFTDMFLTTQMFGAIDLRFRLMADVIVYCESIGSQVINNVKVCKYFKYTIYNRNTNTRTIRKVSFDKAKEFFDLYDTLEVIDSSEKEALEFHFIVRNPTLLKAKVIEISNRIKGSIKKITHVSVKFALLINSIPLQYEQYVYSYLTGKSVI